MQAGLFVFGLVGLVVVEILTWLADMPGETASGLRALMWLCVAGPAALQARAGSQPPDQRGSVRVGVTLGIAIVVFVGAAILSLFVHGCGPRQLVLEADDDPPMFDVRRGPPCYMALLHDGEIEASVEHRDQRCRVRINGKEVP